MTKFTCFNALWNRMIKMMSSHVVNHITTGLEVWSSWHHIFACPIVCSIWLNTLWFHRWFSCTCGTLPILMAQFLCFQIHQNVLWVPSVYCSFIYWPHSQLSWRKLLKSGCLRTWWKHKMPPILYAIWFCILLCSLSSASHLASSLTIGEGSVENINEADIIWAAKEVLLTDRLLHGCTQTVKSEG